MKFFGASKASRNWWQKRAIKKLFKGGKSDPAGTPLLPDSDFTDHFEIAGMAQDHLRKLKTSKYEESNKWEK
jgi:hypothetical protein